VDADAADSLSALGSRCCTIVIDPVAIAGFDGELRIVAQLERDVMESNCRRLRMEAKNVAIWDVIGDGEEVAVEGLHIFELEIFAASEVRDGLGDIAAKGIAGRDLGEMR